MNANRNKILKEVRYILSMTASPFSLSPRTARAVVWVAPVALTGVLFSYEFIGFLTATLVFTSVFAKTPAETWKERFCNLLTKYDPLDSNAYQDLLIKIQSNTAQREDIIKWLSVESAHIERPNEVSAEKALLTKLEK